MKVKNIITTDFVYYKKPSMYIAFPYCDFKCERDCGQACCHNSSLAKSPDIEISVERIIELYKQSSAFTKALVCCGMEPMKSFDDLLELITAFRKEFDDDIVIYTGYNKNEILKEIRMLREFPNIIIKFGRFKPNDVHKFDETLGVTLASANQYAEKIS